MIRGWLFRAKITTPPSQKAVWHGNCVSCHFLIIAASEAFRDTSFHASFKDVRLGAVSFVLLSRIDSTIEIHNGTMAE